MDVSMACNPKNGAEQALTSAPVASRRPLPVACGSIAEEVRVQGLADLANLQQQIDRAKRTLWVLTAAARREPARIEAVIAEIDQLEHAQRALFTRNVEAMIAERCAVCRAERSGSQDGTPLAGSQP
jgi:hypothetical protein